MSYQIVFDEDKQKNTGIKRLADNAFIPFDPANTDYQKFKKDVSDGVELQDSDGNVMTQAEVNAFLETLP